MACALGQREGKTNAEEHHTQASHNPAVAMTR